MTIDAARSRAVFTHDLQMRIEIVLDVGPEEYTAYLEAFLARALIEGIL